ncbi:FAD-binding protein, partial [Streptomyces prunicolor]|uniref:FAD-binding protein n=1 Tax=Streptomyces prunicolor TaxID=67348 RepID=UPI00340BCCDF
MTEIHTGTDTGTYEVVVIGGGAAGLSAALVLGRSRRRTLVVDAGEPRNTPAAHMQGYHGKDDVTSPAVKLGPANFHAPEMLEPVGGVDIGSTNVKV